MTWANPAAAWFLLLIPAVILLYFLKLRRQDVVVSSTLLWQRVLQDQRVNAPFQRLRGSLLLLLQILAILLLTAALAKPERKSELAQARTHLLLVDISASMGTDEGGVSRLELAQDAAREYLDTIPGGEQAVLVRFARRARTLTPVTEDLDLVRDAIDALRIVPAEAHFDPAVELALSIAGKQTLDAVIALFSDGGFPEWNAGEVAVPIEYTAIGTAQSNSGIVALSMRMDLSGSGRPQVFVEIRNFGEPVTGLVSISQDGSVVRAAEARMEAGGRWNQAFEVLGAGLIDVLWEPASADALATDNQAWLQVDEHGDTLVWRVGADNYMLDEGLQAVAELFEFLQVRTIDPTDFDTMLAAASRVPDVIVWERHAPEELPEGVRGHLFFGALPPGVWDTEPPVVELPSIVAWDRRHPVNRFLSYGKVQIGQAPVLPAAVGVTPLLETTGGALIAAFRSDQGRGLVVGFDTLESTWMTDLSYSLFLYNALMYLSGSEYDSQQGCRSEELLTLHAPAVTSQFHVARPDGADESVNAEGEGWLRYAKTDELGPFQVSWEEADESGTPLQLHRTIPVNLLAAGESDVEPRRTLRIAGQSVSAADAPTRTHVRDLWPWLVALVLVLLLGEWFYYHRR